MAECFSNDKCELKICEKLGRYVVATRDLKPGELLLLERPVVVGPYWDSQLCCLGCYSESMRTCNICKVAPLCMNCDGHDSFECEFMRTGGMNQNFIVDYFDLITPLRCLILGRDANRRSCFEALLAMESHCKQRRGTAIWQLHEQKVVRPLQASGFLTAQEDEAFLQRICGILDVNTFEVRTQRSEEIPVRGLYPRAAMLAHDCVGNTFITLDSSMTMRVYTSREIPAGETIYNNYTSTIFGTAARQEHLLEGKYFVCHCARCSDPTELGTHLSSLRCQKCKAHQHDAYIVHHHYTDQWKCTDCQKIMSSSEVQQVLGMARLDVYSTGMDVTKQENFIQTYSQLLSPNHYLVLEMKQKLAAILRNICDNSPRPIENVLQRKMELCRDILPVLRVLQPGISRMTAIALYEYFSSLLDLAQIHVTTKSLTTQQFLDELVKIEQIAKESISMLIYEPPSTPEGQLAKVAMSRLRHVRASIEKQQKTIFKGDHKIKISQKH